MEVEVGEGGSRGRAEREGVGEGESRRSEWGENWRGRIEERE